MAIGRMQRLARHLMNSNQQLGRVRCAEHLLNESIDLRIAILIDIGQPLLLFVQTLAKETGGVAMIKDVPSHFELHLKFRNPERPRAQSLHQPPLEIKEAQNPPRILLDRKFPAQLPAIAGKTIWV